MLIFRGVVPTNKLQELVKLRKTKQENSHTLQRTGANQFTPESQWKRLSRSIPLAFWGSIRANFQPRFPKVGTKTSQESLSEHREPSPDLFAFLKQPTFNPYQRNMSEIFLKKQSLGKSQNKAYMFYWFSHLPILLTWNIVTTYQCHQSKKNKTANTGPEAFFWVACHHPSLDQKIWTFEPFRWDRQHHQQLRPGPPDGL